MRHLCPCTGYLQLVHFWDCCTQSPLRTAFRVAGGPRTRGQPSGSWSPQKFTALDLWHPLTSPCAGPHRGCPGSLGSSLCQHLLCSCGFISRGAPCLAGDPSPSSKEETLGPTPLCPNTHHDLAWLWKSLPLARTQHLLCPPVTLSVAPCGSCPGPR